MPTPALMATTTEVPAEDRTRNPAVWVTVLFVLTFLLQRISLPSISIPVTVPIALIWVGLAWLRGVVTLDPRRLLVWLAAAGISGAMVLPQLLLVPSPYVSFNSWALWIVVWLPLVVRLRDRSRTDYLRTLRAVAHAGLGMAALSLIFVVLQLLGVRYVDWVAEFVPHELLVRDYVISYPVVYGSELYKSNAWITLEPSFLSFMLGACVVAALIVRMSVVKVLILIAGLLSTVAGSGIAVVVGYLLGLIVVRRIAALRKYAVPAALLIAGFWTTVFAEAITRRFSEAADPRSSTALRATEPYVQLWPQWISDPIGILVGQGAGSSAEIVRNLPIEGLLVPSVAKVIFDYGLVGGAALIILMLFTYLRSPEPLFALTLAASMFLLQAASQPLVLCSIMLLALWSPAIRPGLKTRPAPVSPVRTRRDSGVETPVAVGTP